MGKCKSILRCFMITLLLTISFINFEMLSSKAVVAVLVEQPIIFEECTHSYVYKIIKNATCTTSGEKIYQCQKCGEVKSREVISAKGHNYKEATCTAPKTCSRCGATSGSALGHDIKIIYEKGSNEKHAVVEKCKRCSYSEDIRIEEHTFENGVCTICGKNE